jgi:hypothetical protein
MKYFILVLLVSVASDAKPWLTGPSRLDADTVEVVSIVEGMLGESCDSIVDFLEDTDLEHGLDAVETSQDYFERGLCHE